MNTLDYFRQICKIPRESGNEEGMRQYLTSWAKENNFESKRDKAGNIVIYCPATEGFEHVKPLALQGHMDMVCVKTDDCVHDFSKDPIEVYQDGDWLRAKGTSLGADNGIAVAMAMALFTDKTAKHGPLEAVFTFSEETGMNGAFELDGSLINSKRLINLDSEEEGVIYIGCAGGEDFVCERKVEYENLPQGWEPVKITVTGLKGGHSGGEIHLQRLNSIQALARMLLAANKAGFNYMIAAFEGGIRRNVIPSSATCVICIPSENKKQIMHTILDEAEVIKEENKIEEPGFTVEHHCSHCDSSLAKQEKVLSCETSENIMKALFACPHGVYKFSKSIPGIVETSDNLAIVKLNGDKFELVGSCRSLSDTCKFELSSKIEFILESFGFSCHFTDKYPGWVPDTGSKLAALCARAFKEKSGKDALITSIHAGLECGVINSKVDGMDSVSIGPDLFDVHSVNEHVSISSVERLYDIVKYILEITE